METTQETPATPDPRAIWESLTPAQREELQAFLDLAYVDARVCRTMPTLCYRNCGIVGCETWRLTDLGRAVAAAGKAGVQ